MSMLERNGGKLVKYEYISSQWIGGGGGVQEDRN